MFLIYYGIVTSDPCTDYKLIDDPLRSVTNKIVPWGKCDNNIAVGWYRLKINGVDAEIPTACPLPGVAKPFICNADAAGWFSG